MLLQTLLISFLSFWIYEEYLNNLYFQAYVNGYFQGGALAGIILVSIIVFAIVAVVLYLKLRRTRKELEGLISKETVGRDGRGHSQPLDSRTEQHLIEMIRKTQPIMNSALAQVTRCLLSNEQILDPR